MAATTVSFPSCATVSDALAAADAVGTRAGRAVARNDVCRVAIGALGLSATDSLAVARAVFRGFVVHIDSVGDVGFRTVWKDAHILGPAPVDRDRVMLPHHDGGSVTRLEAPGGTGRGTPKAYAGFVVVESGAGTARTTFYDLVTIIADLLDTPGPAAGVRWYTRTMARVADIQRGNGITTRYVTLPMICGARSPALLAVDRNEGHDDLTADEISRCPELDALRTGCVCGDCVGEVSRVHCRGVFAGTGLSWPEFRARYEIAVTAARWDLVLWNNVFRQHGAIGGGAGRTLKHVYAVPHGRDGRYSAWLTAHWNRMENSELTN
jgi:hypothetical protein